MVMPTHGDSFISDNEEELCPLCVEEMDISDKNFKPCPCGYQVCQFCYNNIRENPQLNGRCPACRRPYDDENVEYRVVTQEEWKQDHLRQARREREKKQKERERKETEQSSRKHLAGMRVIQKNLVYVIGLNPNIPTDELHETLRGDQFFGQYGKIQKIVINKRNNANGIPGLGVYVTFARKEDAAKCIAAVDGSINEGKYLRAAYGTTKYCSSYLRGQQCPNPHCMFLHEPGEEADSYTRQDLSTIQHAARQGLNKPNGARQTSSNNAQPSTPISAKAVEESETESIASSESALPPGVSWAQKASPPVVARKLHPLNQKAVANKSSSDLSGKVAASVAPVAPVAPLASNAPSQAVSPVIHQDRSIKSLSNSLETLSNGFLQFTFSSDLLSEEELSASFNIPSYFAFAANGTSEFSGSTRAEFVSFFESLNSVKPLMRTAEATSMAVKDTSDGSNGGILQSGMNFAANVPGGPTSNNPMHVHPKGLFGQGSNSQNSHELLAHLMNGNRGEES